jgi:pyrophosphatase PpaX
VIKLQKIDTVLFDLDGTLVDSNELIIKSFERTLKEFLPERDFLREEIIEMIGPPLKETFKIKSEDPSIIEEMINYYRKVYVEMEFDYIELYPNVIKTLKTLYDNGINLGIVTTKFKESAIPSIEHYGLNKYIKSYCFLDDVNEHKPHPEPIFYALNQFNSYKGVIMVGDNSSDIMAGRNASCLTCGVEWSIKKEIIKELNPDFWLTDYLELIDIVLNNNRRK